MRFGLVGPSYTSRSSAVADEETFNLFTETRGASQSMAPSRMYGGQATGGLTSLYWTPGLSVFCALPQSPHRGSIIAQNRLFAVAGAGLYEVSPSGGYTLLGTVTNDGNPASIAFNGVQLLIVSGGRAYCLTLASNALLDVTAQLIGIPLKVEFDDSYFVVMFQNSDRAQLSNLVDGTTWPPLYVNQVEVFPENMTSIIANHRELWVFGERHAQVYQDTGSAEIYDAIPGAFIETGCVGAFVPCRLDNSVFWVSEDDRGTRVAWRSNGYTPMRISTYAVEADLASYPTLFGMTTYAYHDGGHLFWVLYIPGSYWSWVYDVTEGQWHKRASWNASTATWGAHQSWNHVYAFGQHLVGDWSSGNLYALSQNNMTDNGANIRRLRRAPTVSDEMKWIYHSLLNIDFEMGNLSSVTPSDSPGYASWMMGPKPGGAAINTVLPGGTSWASPANVLTQGSFASCPLAASVSSATSSTSTGTSSGGGAAWTNPGNVDSPTLYASVSLAAGGAPIFMFLGRDKGVTVSASANPSNQRPPSVSMSLSGFVSTPATAITLYISVSGIITASQGGGIMTVNYSKDSGSTWKLVQTFNATFATTVIPVTIAGLSDLSTVQVQIIANASCSPAGFSNVSLTVPVAGIYAILSGSAQPTSQALAAAVTGLTIPAGRTIVGVKATFDGYCVGDIPILQFGMNVGNLETAPALTNSSTNYTVGGPTDLWGYTGWTAATLSSLVSSFYASTTGTSTINIRNLVFTVYHVPTNIPSSALDITHFGFVMPTGDALQGISISIIAYSNVDSATITAQMLYLGAPVGDPQTVPLPTVASIIPFGGLNAQFGQIWSGLDISSAGFGVRITGTATMGLSATIYAGYTQVGMFCPPAVPNNNYVGPNPNLVDGNGAPRPPQCMLRWSDDRGKTWSNERVINLGNLGEYKARALIRRLGRSRYRVYEVSMTDPIPWVIEDGYLEAQ